MPRAAISDHWIDRVRTLVETEPGLSARKIEERLKTEGQRDGRTDWPQERKIRDIKRMHVSAGDRSQFAFVRWPETFEQGALPWDASAAVLELLTLYPRRGYERPSVRYAEWFWRITLAAPIRPLQWRQAMALRLEAGDRRGVEAALRWYAAGNEGANPGEAGEIVKEAENNG